MATQAGVAYVTVAYDPVGVKKLRAETASQGRQIAQSWDKTAQKSGKSIMGVGKSMSKYITLPIVAAGAVAIKFATDFDTSLNHIQALVGANTKQMNLYRKSILDLAPAVGVGPKELADALYFITSSGFKGAAALKVLKASAQAAAAGLGDTRTVANLVTSAVTAYGEANLSAARATDVLTATVREGKGDPAELANALGENIGVAQKLGISFNEVGAAMSALSLITPDVAQDGTQLSGVMSKLLAPAKQSEEAFQKLGLSVSDLHAEIKEKGLLGTLLDLKERMKGTGVTAHDLFPEIRSLRGFFNLTGKAADKNVGIFKRLNAATGDTAKALKAAGGTESFKFKQALAELEVAAINVGEALIPIAVQIADGVKSMAEAFNNLSPAAQKTVLVIAGILAVIGPLVFAIGAVVTVVGFLAEGFIALAAAEFLAAAPITLIVIGLALIAAGLVLAYKRSATFRAVVQYAAATAAESFNVLKTVIRAVAAHFGIVMAVASVAFAVIVSAVRAGISVVRTLITVVGAVAKKFGPIKGAAVSAFNAAASAVRPLISVIQELVGWLGTAASAAGKVASAIGAVSSLASKADPRNLLPHTGGIVTAGGLRLAGGGVAHGGVVGRDSIPALLTPGEMVLNDRQQREMFRLLNGGGAGGGVDVHVYVGNEPVDARVEVAMKKTSRRVQAGRKWGN